MVVLDPLRSDPRFALCFSGWASKEDYTAHDWPGNIPDLQNVVGAAANLGIPRQTLESKIRRPGIDKDGQKRQPPNSLAHANNLIQHFVPPAEPPGREDRLNFGILPKPQRVSNHEPTSFQ